MPFSEARGENDQFVLALLPMQLLITSIYELHLQERNTAGVEEGTEKPIIDGKSNKAT